MSDDGAVPDVMTDSDPVVLYGCACANPIIVSHECRPCGRRRRRREFGGFLLGLAIVLTVEAAVIYGWTWYRG